MAPRPEPTITAEEARALAGKVRPSEVTIEVLQALLKDSPQWHADKRIWFWANTEGKILYSVNENRIHGEGDMSPKMPADTQQTPSIDMGEAKVTAEQAEKTMGSPDVVVEDPETGKLSVDQGSSGTKPEAETDEYAEA